MKTPHTFHIPVMGIGFSIDTPIKIAKYGISSVISLVDDTLIEHVRKYYCGVTAKPYEPITKNDEDFRAKRITAYLNLVDQIVKEKFKEIQTSPFESNSEITKYFELLADHSPLKKHYHDMLKESDPSKKEILQNNLRQQMTPGHIDVNIMTKLDRINFDKNHNELPQEFSDALSALRGYAQSTLSSAIILSAGINRRLYSYLEKFKDFYANANGFIKKQIILKVSDFRSSLTQGRFLAKKGLWVSEYRIESGLNCGGHAFATTGILMGPILEEFKMRKQELIDDLHKILNKSLNAQDAPTSQHPHELRITAQGGIGTAHEHNFLLSYYNLDTTGWATPFLLVPEVSTVDSETLQQLSDAKEDNLYLSNISPLGVLFNNLKDSASETVKQQRIEKNRPGSPCPEGHLATNTEFTEHPICVASRQYQKLKLDQLKEQHLDEQTYQTQADEIMDKSCICFDLGASPMINYNLLKENQKAFTAICPGPNLAYFSKIISLKEMINHIYGRINLLNTQRPHIFINELKMYVNYLIKEIKAIIEKPTKKQLSYLNEFRNNLLEGIAYYKNLFPQMQEETQEHRTKALNELQQFKTNLESLLTTHTKIFA